MTFMIPFVTLPPTGLFYHFKIKASQTYLQSCSFFLSLYKKKWNSAWGLQRKLCDLNGLRRCINWFQFYINKYNSRALWFHFYLKRLNEEFLQVNRTLGEVKYVFNKVFCTFVWLYFQIFHLTFSRARLFFIPGQICAQLELVVWTLSGPLPSLWPPGLL